MGYFKTTVKAGATIEVTKSYTKRIGTKARGNKEKPTAEEMEKVNQMNAERTLRLKINANFGVDDPFITLTYRKEERPTPAGAKKNIKKLLDSLRKKYKTMGAELKYINVTEYQNKAIHHHIIINHVEGVDVSKWVRQLWKFGRPDFKYLDDTGQYKDLAAYAKDSKRAAKERRRAMNSVHFSTGKDDWGTPQDLFDALNEEFNFTLDPCADNNNHKCAKYYTIEQDGLAQSWAGETVFCNPPYSRKTKTNAGQIAWVQKCYKEATEGGDRRGYAYTRPNRYDHVSRLHFRKSRNTIYQRAC